MTSRQLYPETEKYFEELELRFLRLGNEEESREAFTNIYNRYRPRIYRVALKYLRSSDLAEEVVQDVFMTLWQRKETFASVDSLYSYLYSCARNAAHYAFKKTKLRSVTDGEYLRRRPKADNTTDHTILDQQYEELLQQALARLSPQQQQVFRLAREQHLPHDTIARQLNISKLTVYAHIRDALKAIREQLSPHISFSVIVVMLLQIEDLNRFL